MALYFEPIINENLDEISFLIESQIDINEVIENTIPLTYAIKNERFKAAKYLIQCGADINYDKSILAFLCCIPESDDSIELVKILFERGFIKKDPLLHTALIKENLNIAKILLDMGEDINGLFKGTDLLSYVLLNDPDPITQIEFMIDNGFNFNIKIDNEYGWQKLLRYNLINKKIISIIPKIDLEGWLAAVYKYIEPEHLDEIIAKSSQSKLESFLRILIDMKDDKYIEKLLKDNRIDFNISNSYGNRAIHIAVQNCNYPLIEKLIKLNVDINCEGAAYRSPLNMALIKQNLDISELLIDAGAIISMIPDIDNRTDLQYICFLNDYDLIEKVGKKMDIKFVKNNISLFQYALDNRADNILKYAIKNKMIGMNSENCGKPILFIACDGTFGTSLSFLLENGIDINTKDLIGNNALMYCLNNNQIDNAFKLLKANIDTTTVNIQGKTALHFACQCGNLDIFNIIFVKDQVNLKTKNGDTPLIFASRNNLEIVKKLVENGADINHENNQGINAISIAFNTGKKDIIDYLISKDVDIKGCVDKLFINVLNSEYDQRDSLKFLLNNGLDVNKKINGISVLWNFLLHRNRNRNINSIDEIIMLIDEGADINELHNGKTVFAILVERGKIDLVLDKLLKKGLNLNNNYGNFRPLNYLIQHSHLDFSINSVLIKNLVNAGADINGIDPNGFSPVYYCVTKYNRLILDLLLKLGADKDQFIDGCPVIQYCGVDIESIKTFVKYGVNLNARNNKDETILHKIAKWNISPNEKSGVLFKIVNLGADPKLTCNGKSLLSLLAESRNYNYELFIEMIEKWDNKFENNMMKYLILDKKIDLINYVLKKFEIEYTNDIIYQSFYNSNDIMITKIINNNINLNEITFDPKITPLMLASQKCDSEVVTKLIELGCDVNALNGNGENAIVYALSNNRLDNYEILIKAGAKTDIINEDNQTVMDMTLKYEINYETFNKVGLKCNNKEVLMNKLISWVKTNDPIFKELVAEGICVPFCYGQFLNVFDFENLKRFHWKYYNCMYNNHSVIFELISRYLNNANDKKQLAELIKLSMDLNVDIYKHFKDEYYNSTVALICYNINKFDNEFIEYIIKYTDKDKLNDHDKKDATIMKVLKLINVDVKFTDINKNDKCAICYDSLNDVKSVYACNNKHAYHDNCVKSYMVHMNFNKCLLCFNAIAHCIENN